MCWTIDNPTTSTFGLDTAGEFATASSLTVVQAPCNHSPTGAAHTCPTKSLPRQDEELDSVLSLQAGNSQALEQDSLELSFGFYMLMPG